MQSHAWQLDFFGAALPVNLKKIGSKTALKAVIDIINEHEAAALAPVVLLATTTVEAATPQKTYPKFFHGLDVDHPTNLFERLLADRIKESYLKPTSEMDYQDEGTEANENSASTATQEEEGGGIIGAHKKLLKLSLEDLRANRDVSDISSWIMDGNDQARLFSFDACCRVSEIDPDSLRSNLMDGGYILKHYLH